MSITYKLILLCIKQIDTNKFLQVSLLGFVEGQIKSSCQNSISVELISCRLTVFARYGCTVINPVFSIPHNSLITAVQLTN